MSAAGLHISKSRVLSRCPLSTLSALCILTLTERHSLSNVLNNFKLKHVAVVELCHNRTSYEKNSRQRL